MFVWTSNPLKIGKKLLFSLTKHCKKINILKLMFYWSANKKEKHFDIFLDCKKVNRHTPYAVRFCSHT